MQDKAKTKNQLLQELAELRQRVAELEKSQGKINTGETGLTGHTRADEDFEGVGRRLAFIVKHSVDALYQRNLQTDSYDYMSPVIEQLTGFSAEEMANLEMNEVKDLVHNDDLPRVNREIESTSKGEKDVGVVEYRFRSKAGGYRWLSDRFSIMRDSKGRPLYRVGIVRDITERKENEDELRRSRDGLELRVKEQTAEIRRALEETARERQRLYDVLETLPVLICLLTPDYHVRFANRAFRERFGEADGRRCYEYVFGQKEPCRFCETFRVFQTGAPYHWECNAPDGSVMDAHDFPFADIDGSPLILEMDIDITERKRAEKALLSASAYNRSLIEASVDPLVTINSEGKISDVNTATERVTGQHRERLIGTDFSDYFTDPEKARVGYQLAFKEGQARDYELVIRHKDGSTTPVLYNASVYRDESENVLGVFAAARDVAKQRRLEEQLRQAQKMEAIGTLAGGIAHDFNNILAAIIGFTEMASDDVTDRPHVQKSLGNVLKSGRRARELVKQILSFSRKTTHERSTLSLTPVVKETVQLLRASIPATIEIKLSIAAFPDTVLASPVEIQQVLMNLATNASLAMADKGGAMEITLSDIKVGPDSPVLEQEVEPGAYVQLMVRDTGVGMSPDVMKRIFEPFFTTRGVGGGSGMGLAVVYGIVQDLQGTITVESEQGAGSVFRVLLPKVSAGVEEKDARTVDIPGGSQRILFVDDEEMLVEWGKSTLERLGYQVTAVTESEKALGIFSLDPFSFDLVVTDQAMPRTDGARLARKLLRIRSDIPIILCTGHSEAISPERAREIGIREFLMKPLARHELAGAIRRVLGGTVQPRQSP